MTTTLTLRLMDYLNHVPIPAEGTYWGAKAFSEDVEGGLFRSTVCEQNENTVNISCKELKTDGQQYRITDYLLKLLQVTGIGTSDSRCVAEITYNPAPTPTFPMTILSDPAGAIITVDGITL